MWQFLEEEAFLKRLLNLLRNSMKICLEGGTLALKQRGVRQNIEILYYTLIL